MAFSIEPEEFIDELEGKLGLTEIGRGLMHSVIESGKGAEKGKVISESISRGIGGFVTDRLYENIVRDYAQAERLYGETLLSFFAGFDAEYVGKNVRIPEFQRILQKNIAANMARLKDEGLIDSFYCITEKGMQLASLVLYMEELETFFSSSFTGEKKSVLRSVDGSRGSTRRFKKSDRYKDIDFRKSIRRALARKRNYLSVNDLEAYDHKMKNAAVIIYALDASGSMKGSKLHLSKKAGIALAFAAVERKDKVGLLVFSDKISEKIEPTSDFSQLLQALTRISASNQTDIAPVIGEAMSMFCDNRAANDDSVKHLILLSDALPTSGSSPVEETLNAARTASSFGITISVVGIGLDSKGRKLAEEIAIAGGGKFYVVKDASELGHVIMEDYYGL